MGLLRTVLMQFLVEQDRSLVKKSESLLALDRSKAKNHLLERENRSLRSDLTQ